jgi:WD40 repeat protein
MVHCMERLKARGITCAVLDISAAGTNLNVDQWYNSLLEQLGRRLGMRAEVSAFVGQAQGQSPLQKLLSCLVDVVLPAKQGPMVIFVDEIDFVRSLAFETFELFAAIRSMYNLRSVDPEANRLTFCLVGCALPADLIPDPRMTPFNIGKQLTLNDFSLQQALPLVNGLHGLPEPHRAMHRILYWTGGHPYLTQRLCEACVEKRVQRDADVDACCMELFFLPDSMRTEGNLAAVRQRLSGSSSSEREALLSLYIRTLKSKVQRAEASTVVAERLKLTGDVAEENGALRPRNRIYQRVFNLRWAQEHLPEAEQLRVKRAYRQGAVRTAITMSAALCLISALAGVAAVNARRANALTAAIQKQLNENSHLLYVANMAALDAAEAVNDQHAIRSLTDSMANLAPAPIELRYRPTQAHRELAVIQAHGSPISFVQPSGIDNTLLTAGQDGHVRRWDPDTGKMLLDVKAPWKPHWAALSEDGKYLLVMGETSRTTQLWYATEGGLSWHQGSMYDFTQPASSDYPASGKLSGQFCLWHFVTGLSSRFVVRLGGYSGQESRISVRLNRELSYRADTRCLCLLEKRTGKRILSIPACPPLRMAFSPDGKQFAVAYEDGHIELRNVKNGELLRQPRQMIERPMALTFSPDSRLLAAAGIDRNCVLIDTRTGETQAVLRGHDLKISDIAFSLDSKRVYTAGTDGTVRIWDAAQRDSPLLALNSEIFMTHISADSTRIFAATGNGDLVGLRADNGAKIFATKLNCGAINDIVEDTTNGTLLIAGASGALLRCRETDGSVVEEWRGAHTRLTCTVLTRDRAIYVGDQTGHVYIAADHSLKLINSFQKMDPMNGLAETPDGTALMVAGDGPNRLGIVMRNTKETRSMPAHGDTVYSLAFSPDGKTLASCSRDQTVKLWDAKTLRPTGNLLGHGGPIYTLQYSADGTRLLTAGSNSAKLWDVATGRVVLTLRPGGKVGCASLAADGSQIVVGVDNRLMRYLTR